MKQDVLTIVLPIRAGAALDPIRDQLRAIGDEILEGKTERFKGIERLHFFSCCVLGAKTLRSGKRCPHSLLVELCFDGDPHEFVRYFVEMKHAAIGRILANCEGYPQSASIADTIRYLERGVQQNQSVYLGTPGRSERQIDQEKGLRGELAEALADPNAKGVTRAERWNEAVATVKENRKRKNKVDFLPAPRRPLRVRLNPANPLFRARLRGAVRLLSWAAFWLAGVIAAARLAREPWHAIFVIAVPAAGAIAAAASLLLNSPRRITLRARLSVIPLALREFASTALWLLALGGYVIAVSEVSWRYYSELMLFWSFVVALIVVSTVPVAVIAFLLAGRSAAVLSAAAVAGVLIWRLRVDRTSAAELWIAALASVALAVLLTLIYAVALRRIESRREVWNEEVDPRHLERVMRREHMQYQSHLISETEIEPGRLRAGTLRAVLRTVDLLARYWFNLGHLAAIPSIHFARFIVLPERESLILLSNYDGRFEDYLGQFARVWGVTAVWGNTEQEVKKRKPEVKIGKRLGFPRPFLLVLDGARREDRFKLYARESQIESLIWYSAYPELSVDEIDKATALHECMDQPIDDGRTGWLADLRRWWTPPLDEAALAALIDRM